MPTELADRIRRGDRTAVAEALNGIDARRPEAREQALLLLRALAEGRPRAAIRLGLTGAPGAGKSTLLDALVQILRERGQTVGIIAVDPSSQQSGGALLADRIRVRSGASDAGVFFRSMAARGRLGGLAAATRAGIIVLEAAYDWVVVETVGVGQSEGEVADLVDTLVYVAQPGAGDVLQYMKAGLLELPDIFVVNKADLGALAERSARELRSGLELGIQDGEKWKAPVLLLSAGERRGIRELIDAIESHGAACSESERLQRRRRGREHFVLSELAARYGRYGLGAVRGGVEALREELTEASDLSEFDLLERLAGKIEQALMRRARGLGP